MLPAKRTTSSSTGSKQKNGGSSGGTAERRTMRTKGPSPSRVQPSQPRYSSAVKNAPKAKPVKQPFSALKRLNSVPSPSPTSLLHRRINSFAARLPSTSAVASAAFAPLLTKYSSPGQPGLLPTPMEGLQNLKGSIWKRIGNIPLARPEPSPPPSPTELGGPNSKFMEFRQKWEANVKKEQIAAQPPRSGFSVVSCSEKVLRAGSGGIGIVPLMDNVYEKYHREPANKSKLTTKVERLSEHMSKKINYSASADKHDRFNVQLTDSHQISLINDSRPPITKVARERDMGQKSPILQPLHKRPFLSNPHVMPVSWKTVQNQAKKAPNYTVPNATPYLQTPKTYPLTFASPLDLTYPFDHSMIQPLKKFAWDAKQQSKSSFGWYDITSTSILNPILPVLPRLKKPENMDLKKDENTLFSKSNVPVITVSSPEIYIDTPLLKCFSNSIESSMVECDIISDNSSNEEEEDFF